MKGAEVNRSHRVDDVDGLLVGLGILGTGGGGDPEGWGRSILDADRAAGRVCTLIDPQDVPDDAFVVSGGYLGSVADDVALAQIVERWETSFELERAVRLVASEHGRRVDYLVPFELGGGNTPVVMSCAARLGIPMIDGDGVGRAAPETHMCSFLGHGISLTPMPLVGADGTEVMVRAGDVLLADAVGRCVAARGRGLLANAHYGTEGRALKRAVVPGTVTKAALLGRFVLDSGLQGEAGLDAVAGFLGGYPLLHGVVTAARRRESAGFFVMDVSIEGVGRDQGRSMEMVIKNEVMCAKEGGRSRVVFPDLVLVLDPATLRGVMSPEMSPGCEILAAAVPCHPVLREAVRSAAGKQAFASERYGESMEYVPVEELLDTA